MVVLASDLQIAVAINKVVSAVTAAGVDGGELLAKSLSSELNCSQPRLIHPITSRQADALH